MFSVNIYCLDWEKKTCVVSQHTKLFNLEIVAVIQPFLYSVNVFIFNIRHSKSKNTENNIMSVCNTTRFNSVNITIFVSDLFVMLNIVNKVKAPFVPISFYPFSIFPIGNHYSEVVVYYFCTCFYTFLHMYVSMNNM